MPKEPEVKIHKLTIKRGKALLKDETCFLIDMEFTLPNDDWHDHLLDQWKEFYRVIAIDDPKTHKKELKDRWKEAKAKGGDTLDALNKQPRTPTKFTYTHGREKINKVKGKKGAYSYKEYITSTPVTEAALSELKKMQRNGAHSYHTTPPWYFVKLLETLDNHWD